ncbi:amine sulfotransferase [Oncorhynchus kisutch]|uniref:Sulfotransferase n=1 Tax=Oncorhynchus kisutch TaxID=8019 RepID=A0A8C7DFB3_ONCKI|nr:amine sulfotransferase [Oncorhynchus kisutch]
MGEDQKIQITALGLFPYKGINLVRGVHQVQHLDSLETFEIRDDDIVVVTYPRSGTTWTQYILSLLYHEDQMTEGSNQPIQELVPFLEENSRQIDYNNKPSTRTFASHLHLSSIPQGLREKGKVIYIARNPKDVAVSLFNLQNFTKVLKSEPDFNTFLIQFLKGEVLGGSWFDHVDDWYAHKDEFDILSMTYEDMIKDTRGAIVRISNFLGKKLEDQTIDTIVDKSSFKNMKEDPQARRDKQHPTFFEQSGSFIRKGKVGDWKTVFTVAQSEGFDQIYMEKMKDLALEFDWKL